MLEMLMLLLTAVAVDCVDDGDDIKKLVLTISKSLNVIQNKFCFLSLLFVRDFFCMNNKKCR